MISSLEETHLDAHNSFIQGELFTVQRKNNKNIFGRVSLDQIVESKYY